MGRSEGKGRVGDAKDRTESLVGCLTVQAKVDIGVSLFPPPKPPPFCPSPSLPSSPPLSTPLPHSTSHRSVTSLYSTSHHLLHFHFTPSLLRQLYSTSRSLTLLHPSATLSPLRPYSIPSFSTPSHFPVTYPSLSLCTRHPSHPTST